MWTLRKDKRTNERRQGAGAVTHSCETRHIRPVTLILVKAWQSSSLDAPKAIERTLRFQGLFGPLSYSMRLGSLSIARGTGMSNATLVWPV